MNQKPTQKDLIYDFIKSKGRALTHEVIVFGVNNFINNAKERARDLKKEGKVWRMHPKVKEKLYPDCGEEIWSVIPEDKEPPKESAPLYERWGQYAFI